MSGLKKLLFGEEPVLSPPPDPKEIVRKWTRELQSKMRGLDREMESMKREETKVTMEMKKLAKAGASKSSLLHLAQSLVGHRKQREKLLVSKVELNSVVLTLQTMSSQLRVAKTLNSATELMAKMNSMMSIPKLRQIATDMAQEMYKADMIEEQMSDTFEMLQDDDEEELATEEVDKIMDEVVGDMFQNAGTAKYRSKEQVTTKSQTEVENDEEDEMMAKLANLGV